MFGVVGLGGSGILVYLNPVWKTLNPRQANGMAKPKGGSGWGAQLACAVPTWYCYVPLGLGSTIAMEAHFQYQPDAMSQSTNGWRTFELEWAHLGGKEVERRQGGPSLLNPTLFSLLS